MEHSVSTIHGATVLKLRGDIDVSQAIALREVLGTALSDPVRRLVVDLSEVGFVDSAGIGLLVAAHRRAEASGGRIALSGVNEVVSHVLHLTRTDRVLTVTPAQAQAIAHVTASPQ